MALLKFLKGNYEGLSAKAISEGQVLICGDTGEMFVDVAADKRVKIGDFVVVSDINALEALDASSVPTSRLYYVENGNILARSNGTSWTQINKQKTLADLGGVSKSVYDTKIAALEQADTDAATDIANLTTYVGTIPETAEATNIVAYVQEKTAGIATDTALEELTGRVATAEADIDKLEASLAEGGATATAIANAKAAGDDAQADVDALELKVGTVAEGKTVVGLIETAQAQADKGVADAATAQAKADSAYDLAGTKATMDQVNAAISGAGHAVKSEVEQAIANLDAAYKKADGDLKTELQGNIDKKADQTAVDGIDGRVATIEADYLKTADKYNDTKVKEDIAANLASIGELQGEVDTLNGDAETEGSVDYKIAQAVAAIMENPDDTMNSINELVTWIDGHAEDALELSNQVTANKNDIATLNGLVGTTGVAAQIEAAIAEALKVEGKDKYALATELAAAIERIVALEAIDHDHSNKTVLDGITAEKVAAWDKAEENAEAHADSLNSAMNTRVEALEAIDHDHTNKAELDLIASGDKAKWDTAADKAHEHSNKTVLDGITAEKVSAWDGAQAAAEATAASALSGAKTELEGKITAAETAAKGHADTEVGKVQTALDTYKTANDTAVSGKADKATTLAGYGITDAMTADQVNALLTWGSF
jgi:hypothetical protein